MIIRGFQPFWGSTFVHWWVFQVPQFFRLCHPCPMSCWGSRRHFHSWFCLQWWSKDRFSSVVSLSNKCRRRSSRVCGTWFDNGFLDLSWSFRGFLSRFHRWSICPFYPAQSSHPFAWVKRMYRSKHRRRYFRRACPWRWCRSCLIWTYQIRRNLNPRRSAIWCTVRWYSSLMTNNAILEFSLDKA